ncbi:MAG TPA: sulfopyruvate decarboxylase subunit alpha [Candidatus Lokiarchaeia archaeon]|nr:sulfopyruvate decarboxylase subunit alpha [Candidatus Lokiarchaeia archaeon]
MSIDLSLYDALKEAGVNLLLSVPCAMLKGLLNVIETKAEIQHVPATREEEAVGIAAGAYLGGRNPAILMQNSGLGNSVNAIKSLLGFYRIPVAFIISQRGAEGERVAAQVPMGQVTIPLLDCIGMKTHIIVTASDIPQISAAIRECQATLVPVAILLTYSLWKGET